MANRSKEELDRYFDYNLLTSQRLIYLGSHSYIDSIESGTDHAMCEYLIKALSYLEYEKNAPITIYANNLGGDWYHGMAMYDIIRATQCHITIVAWGYAMSMGSIILQAADTRILAPNCTIMIHDGNDDLSGPAKTIEAWAEQSKKLRKKMYQIYFSRMKDKNKGLTLKRIENMCSNDTIFTAQETIDIGLADWILKDTKEVFKYFATDESGSKFDGE